MTPIGQYLVDFGRLMNEPPPPPATESFEFDAAEPDFQFEPEPAADLESIEQKITEARAEGVLAGEAAAREAMSAEIEALRAEHAEALDAARQAWTEQEGERLAELMRTGLADLEAKLATNMVEVLEPILGEAVRLKMQDELVEAIATLLAGDKEKLIQVTGPADLIERLKEKLGEPATLEFTADEGLEVTVVAGDTTIRTQMQAWAERLQSTLGEN